MKNYDIRWSKYILILLASAITMGFSPAAGWTAEQPAGQASEKTQGPAENPNGLSESFQGTVVEVIDAGRHIYVRVDTGKQRIWVAVPSFDGKPGDEVIVPAGVPVANFHSIKLNRRFEMMIFVGDIRRVDKNHTRQ